jgi:vancomycin permeability regulator SanA
MPSARRPLAPSTRIALRACALVVAFAALSVGVCTWVVAQAGAGLAHRGALPADMRDVAIVPGSSARGGRPSPMLRARLEAARWAYAEGRVRAILVSGNEASGEATAMRAWLEQSGVDPSRILVDPAGTRTIETMQNAARRFAIGTAIVCTQETSMDRALYLARQSGIDAVGMIASVDGPHDLRWKGREALKSTLAVVETKLR